MRLNPKATAGISPALRRRDPLRLVINGAVTALVSARLWPVARVIARVAGWTYRLVAKPLTLPLLAVVVVWIFAPDALEAVAALAGLAFLLGWIIRARRRMVIEEFVDYTGEKNVASKGMATLLVAEIDRLSELYRSIDERRGVATVATTQGEAIQATIKVDDVAAVLQNSVSAESKVSVGPVSLPVGTVLSAVGLAARGPRLMSSLHHQNGRLLVVSQLAGSARGGLWRAEAEVPSVADQGGAVSELLRELACQIFTTLTVPGTSSPRAVRCFTEGLRAYRGSLQTPEGRLLSLKRAERKFIEASAEDPSFALAFYNLGVVYRGLELYDEPGAAEPPSTAPRPRSERAFLKAIEIDPGRHDAFHGLAQTLWDRGDPADIPRAIEFAATAVDSDDLSVRTSAYNVLGLARRAQHPEEAPVDAQDRRIRRRALTEACKALLGTDFRRTAVAGAGQANFEPQVATCFRSLGIYFAEAGQRRAGASSDLRRAQALLKQAAALGPGDPSHYFELGKVAAERSQRTGKRRRRRSIRQAIVAFEYATVRASEQAPYWAALAWARTLAEPAAVGEHDAARRALDRALASPATAPSDAFKYAAWALENLGEADRLARVKAMPDVMTRVRGASQGGEQELEPMLGDPELEPWERAQAALALAEVGRPDEQSNRWQEAIELLEGEHDEEVRQRNLRPLLAQSRFDEGDHPTGLRLALEAVNRDPLNYYARLVLGWVYLELQDLAQAREAFANALALLPDPSPVTRAAEANIHHLTGMTYFRRAESAGDRSERRSLAHQANAHFRDSLELRSPADAAGAAWAHRLIGWLHFLQGKKSQAIARLRIAQARKPTWSMTVDVLGYVYVTAYKHELAEYELKREITRLTSRRQEGGGEGATGTSATGPGVERPDQDADPEFPGGDQAALTHLRLTLAYSYADRGANLQEALSLCAEAGGGLEAAELDPETRANLGARCLSREAAVRLELFKLTDDDQQLGQAIEQLESAISQRAEAEAYCLLGLALALKARRDAEKDPGPLLARARQFLRQAEDLDQWGEISEKAKELSMLLDRVGRSSETAPVAIEKTVPIVIGKRLPEAKAALSDAGFIVSVNTFPNDLSAGTVFEQDPIPGSRADEGSTATLSVSAGA